MAVVSGNKTSGLETGAGVFRVTVPTQGLGERAAIFKGCLVRRLLSDRTNGKNTVNIPMFVNTDSNYSGRKVCRVAQALGNRAMVCLFRFPQCRHFAFSYLSRYFICPEHTTLHRQLPDKTA